MLRVRKWPSRPTSQGGDPGSEIQPGTVAVLAEASVRSRQNSPRADTSSGSQYTDPPSIDSRAACAAAIARTGRERMNLFV